VPSVRESRGATDQVGILAPSSLGSRNTWPRPLRRAAAPLRHLASRSSTRMAEARESAFESDYQKIRENEKYAGPAGRQRRRPPHAPPAQALELGASDSDTGSVPHHLRSAQPRALSRKVGDEFTVPLCRIHHREVHSGGDEAAWWNRFGVDPYFVAAALWAQTRLGQTDVELPSYDPSTAPQVATSDPTSVARRPNGPRTNKTKPIIAAGAQ
jgi:hypothetical protein